MPENLHWIALHKSETLSILDVRCRVPQGDCGAEEHSTSHDIVFPRRGAFAKHLGRREFVADANQIVFFNQDQPYRISHPIDGGDDCTILRFRTDVLVDAFARRIPSVREHPEAPFPRSNAVSPSALPLRLQSLRRGLARGTVDALATEETSFAMLDTIVESATREERQRPRRTKEATRRAYVRLTMDAKAVLCNRFTEPLTLDAIASAVGCSACHLARVFRRHAGLPIHRYLNRLRLRTALELLGGGHDDLTHLALLLGFSSHAHFSDAFRREFAVTPSEFRGARPGSAEICKTIKNLKA